MLIKSLKIEKFFKFISVLEEKSLQQFSDCQQALNLETEWYVVGDRTRKEIKYGNQCNMITIWFKDGKFAEELPNDDDENPKYIINNLSQIKKIVKGDAGTD